MWRTGDREATCVDIFAMIERFAGYGFPKAHSAAYAVIAAQTAYLKANHPVEFMAALLSSELGNTDRIVVADGRMPTGRDRSLAAEHQSQRCRIQRRAHRGRIRALSALGSRP